MTDAARRLDEARAARSALPSGPAPDLDSAKASYALAVRDSQIHSFAGMLFGVDPAAVDDGLVATCLRAFVLAPAILVALASTLLALTSVSATTVPATTVPAKAPRRARTVAPRARKRTAKATDDEPTPPPSVATATCRRGPEAGRTGGHLRVVT